MRLQGTIHTIKTIGRCREWFTRAQSEEMEAKGNKRDV
jgi:hypothetical protein